jgi:hypothetical protein
MHTHFPQLQPGTLQTRLPYSFPDNLPPNVCVCVHMHTCMCHTAVPTQSRMLPISHNNLPQTHRPSFSSSLSPTDSAAERLIPSPACRYTGAFSPHVPMPLRQTLPKSQQHPKHRVQLWLQDCSALKRPGDSPTPLQTPCYLLLIQDVHSLG